MKTMTCRQLGGPCDLALHGDTADEVIKAQDAHLKEMVAGGDEAHEVQASTGRTSRKRDDDACRSTMPTRTARASSPDHAPGFGAPRSVPT